MTLAPASPRRVLLFSGHMIDAPGRPAPRFPSHREALASDAIARQLDALQAGPADLAICSGACGGDLIFAEAAQARGIRLEVYLPFDVATFARHSVDFAGGRWRARFDAVVASSELHLWPEERPPLVEGQDPYEQVNLWMLEAGSRFGRDRVVLVALWNGEGGDGPGGTQHMMDAVRRHHGRVQWIDTRNLWS